MKASSANNLILQLMLLFLGKQSTLGENPSWDDLDWEKVLAIGRYQNLIPLLYHVLSSHQELFGKVPSQFQKELEEGFLDDTALTLLYDDLLKKMLVSLHRENIPFITLKGPSMALEFYHPREIRPYTDLDILIKNQDYERVKSILFLSGFKISNSEGEAIRRRFFNSVSFVKKDPQEIYLDLHWETCMVSWNQQPFLNSAPVWENIRWLHESGVKLPVLSPQFLLLYLCLHLTFHHQFGKMLTLCDLDLAIQKFGRDLDWERTIRDTEEMKIKKCIYYSLKVVKSLLKTEIPKSVLHRLRPNRIEEPFFPISYLVFREKPLHSSIERLVKFVLIDSVRQRGLALINFFHIWGKRCL